MESSVKYNLTFDEYHSGARLARIHFAGKSTQPHHLALAKSGFVLLLVVLLCMIACQLSGWIEFDRSQWLLLAFAALIMGMFYLPFMERQWDRRIYKDEKWSESKGLSLREDHIGISFPNDVEVRIPWSSFSYIESESIMVLIAKDRWLVVPKHIFSEDALNQIRKILPPNEGKL